MYRIILFSIGIFMIGCAKEPINIYETKEYQNLTQEDIAIGESVWTKSCFRCHMYGSMGAASVNNKAHFDRIATKGFDTLHESVLIGMDGPKGMMPPKGSCYSCSDDEIKKSVYYIFHLAEQIASQSQTDAHSTE